jgi:hypothetical protein
VPPNLPTLKGLHVRREAGGRKDFDGLCLAEIIGFPPCLQPLNNGSAFLV